MSEKAKVIQFPQKKGQRKAIRNVDGVKYFTHDQIRLLRRTVRDRASTRKLTCIREWAMVDLLTGTGLRVDEAANLRCGDLKTGYGLSGIFVRNGKGGYSRTVQITNELKSNLKRFLKWKKERKEPTGYDDHIFLGQRGPMTRQAVQQIAKKYLKQLELYEDGKSAHSLRHSYAVEYYRKTRDLRGLQKQLGHQNITTTQIYADVTDEDIQENIKGLWGR